MAKKKRGGLLFDDVKEAASGFFSLDPQENVSGAQQVAELGLGFVPGVGQALAARDFERARRAGDKAGMALAAASLVPVGRFLPDASVLKRDIFIGPKSRTWNKAAAEEATKLEKAGVNKEEIWRRTGTYRAPDGKLRQEISDQSMRLRHEFGYKPQTGLQRLFGQKEAGDQFGRVGELIESAPLTESYPNIAQYGAQIGKAGGEYPQRGVFDPGTKRLAARRTKEEGVLDTLTHELQHGVQEFEGFSHGANLEEVMKKGSKTEQQAYRDYLANLGEMEARASTLRRKLSDEERRARFPMLDFTMDPGR